MTDKVNLPVRKFIEQKISDNFRDLDFRRGTAFNDLFAKPAAMLFQPFRHELNMLKINQSILNFDNMSTSDVDLLIGNFFIKRAASANASGIVRIYFRDPGIYRFDRIIFLTQSGLRFLNTSIINTTVDILLANRSEDGLYYLDVFVQSEGVGARYSVKSGEISLIENQPQQILKCENLDDFAMVTDEEDNAQLYAKARKSVAVRNLINDSSIQSVLFNEFTFLRDVFVVGAGDTQMIRDLVTLGTNPPIQVHIGGMTDVYVDTTGITAYELTINSIPENGIIDCVSSSAQTQLMKFESGVLDDTYFFDFNNPMPLAQRGNLIKIISVEFGVTKTTEYKVEQAGTKLRLTGGIKGSYLDGVIFEAGDIIYEFTQGLNGTNVGDYLSYGAGDAWKVNRAYDSFLEVKPSNDQINVGIFNNHIIFDGTSALLEFTGIAGVSSSPTEVMINDILEMTLSNAWGRYKVLGRPSDDKLIIVPETSTIDTQYITFTGTNTFTGTASVGSYIIVDDLLSSFHAQVYKVVSANTLNRAHGQIGLTVFCWITDKIMSETIPASIPFTIFRPRVKEDITLNGFSVLLYSILSGNNFFEVDNGHNFKVGDLVHFDYTSDPDVSKTITSIRNIGPNTMIQVDSPFDDGGVPVLTAKRYSVNNFQPNVIFNRYSHVGKFKQDITGNLSTITNDQIGINAYKGDLLVIHDGLSAGIYPLDSGIAPMPIDQLYLASSSTFNIKTGDSYSILTSIINAGSAHNDVLYVPTNGNDFSAISASFPNSNVDHKVIIASGRNKGVYEVASYLDANRVKINGSLDTSGTFIYTEIKFQNFQASGSVTIIEPVGTFVNAQDYDTLIVNRSGSLSYHMINTATSNTLTINPPLTDDVVGGYTSYSIVRDNINPFVIVDSTVPFEIHAIPDLSDRRVEGLTGHCIGSSFAFSDMNANYNDVGVDLAGYELYILEGSHARSEPYIIDSIQTSTSLLISNTTVTDAENFNNLGFINSTSPVRTEKYEIKKAVTLEYPVSYELYEDYSYFNGTFFHLPILAIRDITLIDPVSGQLASSALVEPTDYSLSVKSPETRYSIEERPVIEFTDPAAFRYKQIRIRYYSDPNIKVLHDFCLSKANRITNNSLLVKRMESTFVNINIAVAGNVEKQTVEDTINEYITTRKSADPIEASDIIKKLYDIGVTYVDTETLSMTAIYYTSDGQRLEGSSRTRIVSPSTATYIPGAINISITQTT